MSGSVTRLKTLRPRLSAESAPLLPAGLMIAVVTAWAATGGGYESLPVLGGGYEPDPWYLGALGLVGLLCATAFGVGRVRLSRWATVACAALAGYVAWSFLSVLWAHDQGTAFLGSDRALVYLAAFVTFAILPWSSFSARGALTLFVGCIGAVAIVTAIRVAVLSDPSSLYVNQRLAYPLGYYNADAALFMTAAVTAIALSAQRSSLTTARVGELLRVGGLLLAGVCLQLAVLIQSRGWLFTAPIVLALTLLLVPGRLRLLAYALIPTAATAAIAPVLLRVYGKATSGGITLPQPHLSRVLHQQGSHAVRAMLIADVALSIVAALAVALDRRVELGSLGPATRQPARRGSGDRGGAGRGHRRPDCRARQSDRTRRTRLALIRRRGRNDRGHLLALQHARQQPGGHLARGAARIQPASADGHRSGQLRDQLHAPAPLLRTAAVGAFDRAAPARAHRADRRAAVRAVPARRPARLAARPARGARSA